MSPSNFAALDTNFPGIPTAIHEIMKKEGLEPLGGLVGCGGTRKG